MKNLKKLTYAIAFFASIYGFAQLDDGTSNVQTYIPSKLLEKDQVDIKLFNNLYTHTKKNDADENAVTVPQESYLTNTLEIFYGIDSDAIYNVGIITNLKSNALEVGPTETFSYINDENQRAGLSSVAIALKFKPSAKFDKFTWQTAFHIPVFKDEPNALYLDKRSCVFENKLFYDHLFANQDWQLFTEVDFAYNFGEKADFENLEINNSERFANNSLAIPISAYLSYFPTSESSVYFNTQQYFLVDLGNEFSQNYTLVGLGGKYQVTEKLNLELSYAKFIRASAFTGLGQTFNLGLRIIL